MEISQVYRGVAFSRLRPGHEHPSGTINSRAYHREDVKSLAESIERFGLIQPLVVIEGEGDVYYVAAGNRRLTALNLLVKDEKLTVDFKVPVMVRTIEANGLALSIEENVERAQLHPVEQFEAYAKLRDRGASEQDIADMYGLKLKEVQGALALGRLSDRIRAAWLAGTIKAESAQAFTMGASHKHQDQTFTMLQKSNPWQLGEPRYIRKALVGDTQENARLLTFVGRKQYEAAGGGIIDDLFGTEPGVSNMALLSELADNKLVERQKELMGQGWAWAEIKNSDNQNLVWNASVVSGGSKASKEDKAKSGCIISLDLKGKIEVVYGLLKPGAAKKGKGADDEKTARGAPVKQAISNALNLRVDQWTAAATKAALIEDTYGDTVAVLLSQIVAAQIMPDRLAHMPTIVSNALPKIRNGLDQKIMTAALQKRFDAKDYFSNAPKAIVLKAISESLGKERAKALSAKKKSDVWKVAVANVPGTGWLPPPMRTAHYKTPSPGSVSVIMKGGGGGGGISDKPAKKKAKAK